MYSNEKYDDPNQDSYNLNKETFNQNQGYYDQDQEYYNQDQGYYDPNQTYNPQQQYYDPYSDQYYDYENDEAQGDLGTNTEDQQDKIDSIESNRLYLKKIRKQCVFEDFTDLEQKQLFLFEIVIDSLEVNSDSVLGLTNPEADEKVYVVARAQFLNSPHLDITDADMHSNVRLSMYSNENEYLQTVGNSWQSNHGGNTHQVPRSSYNPTSNSDLLESSGDVNQDMERTELDYDVKWRNINGKSCLFSMTAFEMIHGLDRYPVNIQVDRCVGQKDGSSERSETLGYTTIRLTDQFPISVLQSLKLGVMLPVTTVQHQTCDIHNVFGVKKGRAEVTVRLSTFGPVIITSFQSTGEERTYSFLPRPVDSTHQETDRQTPRSDLLKPLLSEEESMGITKQQELDPFQKSVIWKGGIQQCPSQDQTHHKTSNLRGSEFDLIEKTKMPLSSDIDLCRNPKSPTEHKQLQKYGTDLCDWHKLVGLEILNNPQPECVVEGGDNLKKQKDLLNKLKNGTSYKPMPPIVGLGLKPEAVDCCSCNCDLIRRTL